MSDLRIIQYLGSKIKILDEINKVIQEVTPSGGTVVDLFSGTGVVSHSLISNYKVYSNDVQKYSMLLSSVLVSKIKKIISYEELSTTTAYKDNKKRLTEIFKDVLDYEKKALENTDYHSLVELQELSVFYNCQNLDTDSIALARKIYGDSLSFFSENNISMQRENKDLYCLFCLYYSEGYFSMEQCIEIDSIRKAIDYIDNTPLSENIIKQAALVCLMHATSEIVSTVGKNFAQPMKLTDSNGEIKCHAVKRLIKDRQLDIKPLFDLMAEELKNKNYPRFDSNQAFAFNAIDFFDKVNLKHVDTYYLDPPYTIDHYSRFYHVLETLVLYDYPTLQMKKYNGRLFIMNGRYRTDRYQSNYCISSKGKKEFETLFKIIKSKGANLVLSYSDSSEADKTRKRVLTKQETIEMLKSIYGNVEVINLNHRYKKLSSKISNRKEIENSELLFVCRR